MQRSIFLLALAGLLLAVPGTVAFVLAEEESGTDCGLYALLRGQDKGERAVYDGVRKGLELARLPRVCLETIDPWPGGLPAFLDARTQAGDPGPLFALGDEACEAVAGLATPLPRVFVLLRYSVNRVPLRALPAAPRSAAVYADVGAERVGQILADLFGRKDVAADFTWGIVDAPDRSADIARFHRAAGLAAPLADPTTRPEVMLHLRLGIDYPLLPYDQAVAQAKKSGVPLVSDDRGRFGQGAIVTLVPAHDLLGRAAAEAGRRLRADPDAGLAPRAIAAVEVWIDLNAADEQGIALPLPFVAKADRLRASRVRR